MNRQMHFSRVLVLFIFLFSGFGGSLSGQARSSESKSRLRSIAHPVSSSLFGVVESSGLQITQMTDSHLIFEFELPPYRLISSPQGAASCQVIELDHFMQAGEVGEPQIPVLGTLVGIPVDSSPIIQVLEVDRGVLPGEVHLCPVASPILDQRLDGTLEATSETFMEDPEAYSTNAFSPSEPVKIDSTSMIRSQRVAKLSFMPFSYHPASAKLAVIKRLVVELSFGEEFKSNSGLAVDEGAYEATFRQMLSNYEQAKAWRVQPLTRTAAGAAGASVGEVLAESAAYKIEVAQDGIYQVTYAALSAAGLPVNELDPRTFRLSNQGVEVPLLSYGEEDGIFNAADSFLFYGQKNTTKFSDANTYWLTWGSGNGLRMSFLDGTPTVLGVPSQAFTDTSHLEKDVYYLTNYPSGVQLDHWYWNYVSAVSAPATYTYTFQITNLYSATVAANLSGLIKGLAASPQHHSRIYVNSYLVDDATWPPKAEYSFSVNFPQSYLQEGSNTIRVQLPRDGGITLDQIYVNWFEIEYSHDFTAENSTLAFGWEEAGTWDYRIGNFVGSDIRLFDITNPLLPKQILNAAVELVGSTYQAAFEQPGSGRRYLILEPSKFLAPVSIAQDTPSDLKNTANGADYLLISHNDFIPVIQPLADYRQSQGLRVKVVDVQDIYDEFNGGVFEPDAIRRFLAYAYSQWTPPAPSYVLLVGDGHYDFKNNYGGSWGNFIPPYLGEYDPWIGETASDNRYVMVSGADILPDMHIGRFPVNSTAEAYAMVAKVLSYEQDPIEGGWNFQMTFITDNADDGGDFAFYSDHIADHYIAPYQHAEKIYYGVTHTSLSEAQAAILDAINQGRLVVNFTGHASITNWAAEKLFGTGSVASLTNTGKYPLFVAMTCQEGYFIRSKATSQNIPSLAETFVRLADKGSIASYSPTGYGFAAGHDILTQGLFTALFHHHPTTLGAAVTYSKLYLYTNGSYYKELIDTFVLFGDPALTLRVDPKINYLPLILR